MGQSYDVDKKGSSKTTPKAIIGLILDILLCRGDFESTEKGESEPISVRELFRFASTRDIIYLTIGASCALIGGAVQPLVLILGGFITTVYLGPEEKIGNDNFWNDVMYFVTWLAVAGVVALVTSFLQLHDIIPALCSCVVCRELCADPNDKRHFRLRQFAAMILAMICKRTHVADVRARITTLLCKIFTDSRGNLASIYGALYALGELGSEVYRV
ncbi:unnamed protein product [Heligmosomoides polygyrus]|uniref:TAF6_C domain-containing protein n=1 Tax=Heligmosomoides polygyrus TaxID=6339 RepID=A0A3P7YQS9_HELPZ|nr:unnamed protein product [Heligmosomoides polygyrus]